MLICGKVSGDVNSYRGQQGRHGSGKKDRSSRGIHSNQGYLKCGRSESNLTAGLCLLGRPVTACLAHPVVSWVVVSPLIREHSELQRLLSDENRK